MASRGVADQQPLGKLAPRVSYMAVVITSAFRYGLIMRESFASEQGVGKIQTKLSRLCLVAQLSLAPYFSGMAEAQPLGQQSANTLLQAAPPSVLVTPNSRFVGTTPVQVGGFAPPKQMMLAWKYANERLIATVVQAPSPQPNSVSYARFGFRPAASMTVVASPVNLTFKADVVDELVVDTSHPPEIASGN